MKHGHLIGWILPRYSSDPSRSCVIMGHWLIYCDVSSNTKYLTVLLLGEAQIRILRILPKCFPNDCNVSEFRYWV